MSRPAAIGAALILLAFITGAQAGPLADTQAERLLLAAFRGPVAPFEGRQRSVVCLENGSVSAEVDIRGDGKGRLRREYRTGAAAGVVTLQAGGSVWQRVGKGVWNRLPRAVESPAAAASSVLKNYNVRIQPEEKLLGRAAVPIRIEPRQKFNPSRRLWLDARAGILLKDQLFAPDGRMRSSTEFTALTLRPQAPSLFQPPSRAEESELFGPASFSPRKSAEEVQRESGRPVLLPAHIPPGYRIVLYGVMTTGSGRKMPAVRYSDGLAAFTVFQRGMGGPGPGGGMGRGFGPGPGRGRGRGMRGGGGPGGGRCIVQSSVQQAVVQYRSDRANYLLVGDLTADELERIAQSLP
jgi:hypothetical protein